MCVGTNLALAFARDAKKLLNIRFQVSPCLPFIRILASLSLTRSPRSTQNVKLLA